jgi:membrane associated rhomboid family serine protease
MSLSITTVIIIITTLVSLGAFTNQKILADLIFYPPAISRNKQWYRFFTCALIHADFSHLIFNMLSLFFFGRLVEEVFTTFFPDGGKWIYLIMYISAMLISLLPTYFKHKDNYHYRSLGASGAVSAVIFAGLIIAPTEKIYIFFIPIGIPGFIFAPLYLIISAMMDRKGGDNINHSAHIWGALYGVAFIIAAGYLAGYEIIPYFIGSVKEYLGM